MPSLENTPIFEVADLTHIVEGRTILSISQLSIDARKIYCLYGPNGAGKTTLFEMLTMLRKPTNGVIRFRGEDVYSGNHTLLELRSHVTLVHQDPLLFDTTVEKNVDYGLRIRKIDRHIRKERVQECLRLVGLDGFQKRKARTLSGGEAQRIAIARALAIKPDVLLLDEFSANVDQGGRRQLEAITVSIKEQFGTTVIFTTHYLDQAYQIADEVLYLFRGKLTQSPLKNLFHGVIGMVEGEIRFFNDQIHIYVATEYQGPASVVIPPEAVSLSRHPLDDSSVRNNLQGTITHIIDAGNRVDIKVNAGETFEATITKESFHRMGLQPGMLVCLNFKATAVGVYER